MIVRSVNNGWTIVFHTSHGLLAQQIANVLDEARDLPFWFETQVAIGLHDDVHQDYAKGQRKHLTDAGAPRDFTLVPINDGGRVAQTQQRIDEAFRKHSWLGVLQSKHAECLYRGEDAARDMQRLLDEEAKRRAVTLKRLEIEPAIVQTSYDWMRFCDRLSLILCGSDVPAMTRRLEIISDDVGRRFEIWRDDTEHLRIAPWPFARATLELSVECRTLVELSYTDDAALETALKACPIELRTILISDAT